MPELSDFMRAFGGLLRFTKVNNLFCLTTTRHLNIEADGFAPIFKTKPPPITRYVEVLWWWFTVYFPFTTSLMSVMILLAKYSAVTIVSDSE
jgi:hypothetical protein